MARGRTALRVAYWGFWGAAAGVVIGLGIGSFIVSQMDCSGGVTCEWSFLVPVAGAFWGFWAGLLLGIVACLVYLGDRRRKGLDLGLPHDDPPSPT
jgi:hypothetical protein